MSRHFGYRVFRIVRIAVGRRLLNRSTDISTPCIGLSGAFNKIVAETISFSSLVGRWLTLDNGLPRFCLQFSESNHSNFPWTEKWRISRYLPNINIGWKRNGYISFASARNAWPSWDVDGIPFHNITSGCWAMFSVTNGHSTFALYEIRTVF